MIYNKESEHASINTKKQMTLRWLHTLSLCRPVKHALMKRVRRRREEEEEGGVCTAGGERSVWLVDPLPKVRGGRGGGGGGGTYITETSRVRVPKELLV